MIDNATFENVFSSGNDYNIQFVIACYRGNYQHGTYLTNEDIGQESYSLLESISDGEGFRLGLADASEINLQIKYTQSNISAFRQSVFVVLYVYAFDNPNLRVEKATSWSLQLRDLSDDSVTPMENPILDENVLRNGLYYYDSYEKGADKDYIEVKMYDAIGKLGKKNITTAYKNLYDNAEEQETSVTCADLYRLIFSGGKCGLDANSQLVAKLPSGYSTFADAVNSSVVVPRNITSDKIYARDILNWVLELNGLIARAGRDVERIYYLGTARKADIAIDIIALNTATVDKTYTRYERGKLTIEDYNGRTVTGVKCVDRNGTEYTSGTPSFMYQIDSSSNPLVVGMGSTLQTVADNLYPALHGLYYYEMNVTTYGDPCVEIGDVYEVVGADGVTVICRSIVNIRSLTGIQKMTDVISLNKSKYEDVNIGQSSDFDSKMDKVEPRGSGTFAMNDCTVTGNYSTAFGTGNTITGRRSFSVGASNTITGDNNTALGVNNTASAGGALVSGYSNSSTGSFGTAIGYENDALNGLAPIAIGSRNTANGGTSPIAIGYGLYANGTPYGCALGHFNDWNNGDILEVGNGTADDARSNALRIKSDGTLEARYAWQLVGEEKATTGMSDVSAISIPNDIMNVAVEFLVCVTFPASYQWQGIIDFIVRNPYNYGETWDNNCFMKGYYYSNQYNACIAIEPVFTGNNKRIRLRPGFSQVTNNGSSGTYSLTVFWR